MINKACKKSKNGFTLAEILVTLAIIGVVAALTIPSLMTNTQDQQLKTAWKKKYSEIAQATNEIISDRGSMLDIDDASPDQLRSFYQEKMSIIRNCNWGASAHGICWHNDNEWYADNGTTPLTTGAVSIGKPSILSDGSFITFAQRSSTCSYIYAGFTNMCAEMFIDTNGFKKPNTWGKDIMEIYIFKDGIKPRGVYGNNNTVNKEALLLTQ